MSVTALWRERPLELDTKSKMMTRQGAFNAPFKETQTHFAKKARIVTPELSHAQSNAAVHTSTHTNT